MIQSLQKKLTARLFAVQAAFQMESINQDVESITEEFKTYRFDEEFEDYQMQKGDRAFFTDIVENVIRHQGEIDQQINRILVDEWPIERIDPTLRAIFRVSGGEVFLGKTPLKVVVSEYVEITKAFYPEGKEISFVHAVLDKLTQSLKGKSGEEKNAI